MHFQTTDNPKLAFASLALVILLSLTVINNMSLCWWWYDGPFEIWNDIWNILIIKSLFITFGFVASGLPLMGSLHLHYEHFSKIPQFLGFLSHSKLQTRAQAKSRNATMRHCTAIHCSSSLKIIQIKGVKIILHSLAHSNDSLTSIFSKMHQILFRIH